ncbi:lipopolysaccharide biosynthesis protein [Haliea salexigens]|uniref:lipopolysaccharide biosynthesis protein n=1 Tax=Haliea salexigens TaxID=287487 RepID=UPI0004220039|nr:lipopolysaccharide biosynthesis protein [Haliea salexigens]
MTKSRIFTASAWSAADVIVRQGIQFAIVVALARLVAPEDFGVVAILAFFTSVASVIVDGGMSTALIQRQDINHVDESTAFWLNVGLGFTFAVLILLVADYLPLIFDIAELSELAVLAALTVFLSSLGSVHTALLTKQLNFRTQLVAGILATLCTGSVSIIMAVKGFGVWALSAQILGMASLNTTFLWAFNKWRPQVKFSAASARKLFGFGGFVLTANLVDTIYTRAYSVLIGRYIGTSELGFYARADHTHQLPLNFLTSVFGRVALPIFSEAAGESRRLLRGMKTAVRGMMLVNLPCMFGLAALAEPVILTIYGDLWSPAVGPFRILCIGAAFWPMQVINIYSLMAQGGARTVLLLEIPKKIIGVALLIAGLQHGIIGVAWSYTIFSVISIFINCYFNGIRLGYGARSQLSDIWPTFILATVMAVLVFLGEGIVALPDPARLGILAVSGAAFFLMTAWAFRLDAFLDGVTLFKRASDNTSTTAV